MPACILTEHPSSGARTCHSCSCRVWREVKHWNQVLEGVNGFSVDLLTFLLSCTPRVQIPTREPCGSSSESRSLQEQELEQAERDADIKKETHKDNRGSRTLGRQGCGGGCPALHQEETRRQGEATKPRAEVGWGTRCGLNIHGGKGRGYLKSHLC